MKNNFVLCELYYKPLHGNTNLEGHYLVIGKFDPFTENSIEEYTEYDTDDEYETNEIPNIRNISVLYRDNYRRMLNTSLCVNRKHTVIRNYISIINSDKYFSPQIAECIVLPSQETIAIIKTIWIKLIQRTWKKIFLQRKKMMYQMVLSSSYFINQNTAKNIPGIKGMLFKLKKNIIML
jgi:hypothetical protein